MFIKKIWYWLHILSAMIDDMNGHYDLADKTRLKYWNKINELS